jgi:hypothetical protein
MYVDGSIDAAHMSVNSVDSDSYVDGSIDAVHLSANSVDSDAYVDGSIDLAHMSSESVDEDNLHISNAGSNDQFLQKQSGNAGGLTWAAAGGDLSFGGDTFGADKTIGSNDTYSLSFETDGTERLKLHSDGRGLSQFTAKVWCRYNQTGTPSITDSHNVSSITDNSTGNLDVTFANSMANNNYMYNQDLGQWSTGYSRGRTYVATSGTNTTKIQCRTLENESFADMAYASVIVFGD